MAKARGFSNACNLVSRAWDFRCLGPTFPRTHLCTPFRVLLTSDRNKAVAQGAIAYFLDGIVRSRMSRHKYGIRMSVRYDPYDYEHAERASKAVFMADGIKRLPDAFSTILNEVSSVSSPLFSPSPRHIRVFAFLKRRSSGRPSATSRDHGRDSTKSAILSKPTREACGIHAGSTLNLVTSSITIAIQWSNNYFM